MFLSVCFAFFFIRLLELAAGKSGFTIRKEINMKRLSCGIACAVFVISHIVLLSATGSADADILTFQNGIDGYDGTRDSGIRWGLNLGFAARETGIIGDIGTYEFRSTNLGGATKIEVANLFHSTRDYIPNRPELGITGPIYRYGRMFLKFNDIIGTGPGQVSPDLTITRATLELYNTEDFGSAAAVDNNILTDDPNDLEDPKLSGGAIAIYPVRVPIVFGKDVGVAGKNRVTGDEYKRSKQSWSVRCSEGGQTYPEDPVAASWICGPRDINDIHQGAEDPNHPIHTSHATRREGAVGPPELDWSHPGSVVALQDATEGTKSFDVTRLVQDGIFDSYGVYLTSLMAPTTGFHHSVPNFWTGEAGGDPSSFFIPTRDENYGNTYRTSAHPDIGSRPKLIVEFVPEPATSGLLGLGALALLYRRRYQG